MDMLNYYGARGIVPVHQALPQTNWSRFRAQRESLYSNLGLQPGMVAGKRVLEIGPGTGDNATCILAMEPSEMLLVDGNSSSIEALTSLFAGGQLDPNVCSVIQSDARNLDLLVTGLFDVVICEGVVNGQDEPSSFLKVVSTFVKPGGMLLITNVSAWGVLDAALRRLFVLPSMANGEPYENQLQTACDIFQSHLRNLPTSKPIEDWVQDAILHPLSSEYIFSSAEAVALLTDEFVVTGSSPRILQDFRWHKSLPEDPRELNEMFREQYALLEPMWLDDRLKNPFDLVESLTVIRQRPAIGDAVRQVWDLSCRARETLSVGGELEEIEDQLVTIVDGLNGILPKVPEVLSEYLGILPAIRDGDINALRAPLLEEWWGRGLNYLSLRRIE